MTRISAFVLLQIKIDLTTRSPCAAVSRGKDPGFCRNNSAASLAFPRNGTPLVFCFVAATRGQVSFRRQSVRSVRFRAGTDAVIHKYYTCFLRFFFCGRPSGQRRKFEHPDGARKKVVSRCYSNARACETRGRWVGAVEGRREDKTCANPCKSSIGLPPDPASRKIPVICRHRRRAGTSLEVFVETKEAE